MSLVQLLLPEFDEEMSSTRQVLARVPDAKLKWRPHERSMTLGRLAAHLAELPKWAGDAFSLNEVDIGPPVDPSAPDSAPQTTSAILDSFDAHVHEARGLLEAARDADFADPWTLKAGARILWTKPRLTVYRSAINHMVHHRGQLTVYLRLNNVPVPGPYGPSADELANGV